MDSSKSTNRTSPQVLNNYLKKKGIPEAHDGETGRLLLPISHQPRSILSVWRSRHACCFCKKVKLPGTRNPHNVDHLRRLVQNGPDQWPGANWVETPRSSGVRSAPIYLG